MLNYQRVNLGEWTSITSITAQKMWAEGCPDFTLFQWSDHTKRCNGRPTRDASRRWQHWVWRWRIWRPTVGKKNGWNLAVIICYTPVSGRHIEKIEVKSGKKSQDPSRKTWKNASINCSLVTHPKPTKKNGFWTTKPCKICPWSTLRFAISKRNRPADRRKVPWKDSPWVGWRDLAWCSRNMRIWQR